MPTQHTEEQQDEEQKNNDDPYIDQHNHNMSMEVLTSRIRQRNQELVNNSQISSSNIYADHNKSYCSVNSNGNKIQDKEIIKMPQLTSTQNSPTSVDENPIICFPAELSADLKFEKIRDSKDCTSGFYHNQLQTPEKSNQQNLMEFQEASPNNNINVEMAFDVPHLLSS